MTTPCYIVTGAAGFIGSNLCAELSRRKPGCHIVAIDDFVSGSFANLVSAYERTGLDPFDGEFLPASVEEIDFESLIKDRAPAALFHLGAITDTTIDEERLMLEVNSESFGPMLSSCVASGVPLVYASSAATYGTPDQAHSRVPFPTSAAGKPNNVYGFSKWLMEAAHARIARLHPDAHVVGLRYFNVFGPGEEHKGKMASMVYQLATQMLSGESPRLFSPGDQARDQISVHDVVDCTLAGAGLGDRPLSRVRPGVYNLGSGAATSFNQIVEALRAGLGITEAERPTEYFEMPPDIRAFYQDFTCADITETTDGLGWEPAKTPPERIADYATHLQGQWRQSHATA